MKLKMKQFIRFAHQGKARNYFPGYVYSDLDEEIYNKLIDGGYADPIHEAKSFNPVMENKMINPVEADKAIKMPEQKRKYRKRALLNV